MDNNTYNNYREQIDRQYQKALKIAEKEQLEAIQGLDVLRKTLNKSQENINSNPQIPIVSIPAQENRANSYGSLTDAVMVAFNDIPRNFNKNHLKRALNKSAINVVSNSGDSSLSGCLLRLRKKGIIEITRRGKGSTPTKYRKRNILHN